jgi:Protein of unknown function (DUF2934)
MKGVHMFDEVGERTKGVKSSNGGRGNRVIGASTVARRPLPFLNDIRARAYEKWVAAGRPPGDGMRFWLEAEQEIQQGR